MKATATALTIASYVDDLLHLKGPLAIAKFFGMVTAVSAPLVDVDRGLFDPIIILESDVLSNLLGEQDLANHRTRSLLIIYVQVEFLRRGDKRLVTKLPFWELQLLSRITLTTDPLQMRRMELLQ